MNSFGFTLSDAQQGLFMAFSYGVWFGFIIGLLRYLFFRVFEAKAP